MKKYIRREKEEDKENTLQEEIKQKHNSKKLRSEAGKNLAKIYSS